MEFPTERTKHNGLWFQLWTFVTITYAYATKLYDTMEFGSDSELL